MPIEIKLPQWGMNMNDGTVVKWLKTVGEKITKDEPLVEIESTKVSSAVEAMEDGILGRIDVEEGALVPVGTVLGLILLEGEKIEDFPATKIEQKLDNKSETQIEKQISTKKIQATPRARNLAKKLNVDINDFIREHTKDITDKIKETAKQLLQEQQEDKKNVKDK